LPVHLRPYIFFIQRGDDVIEAGEVQANKLQAPLQGYLCTLADQSLRVAPAMSAKPLYSNLGATSEQARGTITTAAKHCVLLRHLVFGGVDVVSVGVNANILNRDVGIGASVGERGSHLRGAGEGQSLQRDQVLQLQRDARNWEQ
jgi:hypothetical protein